MTNIWLYVLIMSRTSFRVDRNFITCLNVKEIVVRSRRHIWSLSDSKVIRAHNHLVRKRTLNHLAKLTTMLLVFICTVHLTVFCYYVRYEFQRESTLLNLSESQGTPCLKQGPCLKFKWQQCDSNSQSLIL